MARTGTPTTPDDGCNPIAADLTGKVVLIRRGTCGFFVKATNAQTSGSSRRRALQQRSRGDLSDRRRHAADHDLPWSRSRTWPARDRRGDRRRPDDADLDVASDVPCAVRPGGLISSFSSWARTAELGLKPDLSAPGRVIRSTWPVQQFGGHNVISGTSMAAPHVAGAAAVLLSAGKSPASIPTLLSTYAAAGTAGRKPDLGLLRLATSARAAGVIKVDRSAAATHGSRRARSRSARVPAAAGADDLERRLAPVTYRLSSSTRSARIRPPRPSPSASTWARKR